MEYEGARYRTLHSVARRVLACYPITDDPAECGLGRGALAADAFAACRAYLVSGAPRKAGDESSIREITSAVGGFLSGEGATEAVPVGDEVVLRCPRGVVRNIHRAALGMPPAPGKDPSPLDRTMGRGWKLGLWTLGMLYREVLGSRREAERALEGARTVYAISALGKRLPRDLVMAVLALARSP